MAKVDRSSIYDAKRIVEQFIPDAKIRHKFINFLGKAILFANSIKDDNWNLNLDIKGHFLRFNVGHEYCIELRAYNLLILCDKATIRDIIIDNKIPVIFRGYTKELGEFINKDFDTTPDLLVKAPNSIGCIIELDDIEQYIDFFEQSNRDFIEVAMNTRLMPIMQKAHSSGAVEYVFSEMDEKTVFNALRLNEEKQLKKAIALSAEERQKKLQNSPKKPKQLIINRVIYQRNPYVVAEALYRANGFCERCNNPAPFLRDSDNTPYLEVHHIVSLAEGGDDTVENVKALCPNCHRQAHHGKKTY